MTKVLFERGIEGSLPTAGRFDDGVLYFAKDSGNAFLGRSDGTAVAIGRNPYYATCTSAASTAGKTVNLMDDSDVASFELKTGVVIVVRFSSSNSAASPTLNVNGTGAVAVKMYGSHAVGSVGAFSWYAGECVPFVYDGSYWLCLNHIHEVHTDWNETSQASVNYISNKPAIKAGSAAASIVEGDTTNNTASESYAHAEGQATSAAAFGAHTEGYSTQATGNYSHAEGSTTTAQNYAEHAEGRYNKSNKKSTTFGDAGNTMHSVGIGTGSNARKNALEVMQNGDVYVYGLGSYTGDNIGSAGVQRLQDVVGASATDANVVHKANSEIITGSKDFRGGLIVKDCDLSFESASAAKHPVNISLLSYYNDGNDGVAVLGLDDPSGNGDVIIRYVAEPVNDADAANKKYVDDLVGDIESLLAAL